MNLHMRIYLTRQRYMSIVNRIPLSRAMWETSYLDNISIDEPFGCVFKIGYPHQLSNSGQ